jgi:hypothetical protein
MGALPALPYPATYPYQLIALSISGDFVELEKQAGSGAG